MGKVPLGIFSPDINFNYTKCILIVKLNFPSLSFISLPLLGLTKVPNVLLNKTKLFFIFYFIYFFMLRKTKVRREPFLVKMKKEKRKTDKQFTSDLTDDLKRTDKP